MQIGLWAYYSSSSSSEWPRTSKQRHASMHNLDDDSLLSIFHYCRSHLPDESEFDNFPTFKARKWEDECWWYKLVKVCRRWRHLILGSAYHLRLSLLCTHGSPVEDMLAYRPPLPLIIDYHDDHNINVQEEVGMLVALNNRDRVRRIRLHIPILHSEALVMAFDEEFPMLEYLAIAPQVTYGTSLILPKKFQAPHLRHLMISDTVFSRGSPLFTSAACLVTLSLVWVDPSIHLYACDLLQYLSCVPQLEKLQISFYCPLSRKTLRRMLRAPIMTHATLPNLRRLGFEGPIAYLETLLPFVTAPSLEKLRILFFYQPTLAVPHLLQFLSKAESLRFAGAKLTFYEKFVSVVGYPSGVVGGQFSCLYFDYGTFDQQVASTVQIFNSLWPLFSVVEDLTIEYARDSMSSEWHTEVDHTRPWHVILRSFGNVKALFVDDGPGGEMSRCLLSDDGGSPMNRLPELKELSYSTCDDVDSAFTAFADVRKKAGNPVVLVRRWTQQRAVLVGSGENGSGLQG